MAMALLARATALSAATAAIAPRPQLPSRALRQRAPVGLRRRAACHRDGEKRMESLCTAALPDPHSIVFLGIDLVQLTGLDSINLTDFPVKIELDPTREIIVERSTWALGEEAIKTFYMAISLVFCWGCCVFGSMNDAFSDSERYRKEGGNGTGHWIYDQQERAERAAREEIWSDDLIKEIEEKAEEVRRAEEEEAKKKQLV